MFKLVQSRPFLSLGARFALATMLLFAISGGTPQAQEQNQAADAPRGEPESPSREEKTTAPPADEEPTEVQLKNVFMFHAGVSFFEHRANVRGDAELKLKFQPDKINDLLKSMIVHDAEGTAGLVTYDSQTPVEQILKTFAFDLSENVSLADLLRQVRGERVRVDAPQPVTGTILSVTNQRRQVKHGDDVEILEVEMLHLQTAEGLKTIPMTSISNIALVDARLNNDLQKALEVLARSHDTTERTVTITFRGEGERPVAVGYVQPTPVWKMSYRLALDEEQPHRLQGWAIVENTTEQDWKEVALTLVSGRPVSFVMDLYQSLYVNRPEVQLDLYSNLRPQVYEQDLALDRADEAPTAPPAEAAMRSRAMAPAAGMGGMGGGMAEGRRRGAQNFAMQAEPQIAQLQAGVQAMAQAQDVGELFQYKIDIPVTLDRHQSAMLPVINGEIEGEKFSIYDPAAHAKHPMNGLKLTNSTDLYLMEGPITVFDEGVYAGEALIKNLAPGEERLVSYALDLDVEVATPTAKAEPEQLLSVRIDRGTLQAMYKHLREREYQVKNSANKPKRVLIQSPRDPQWELIAPEKPHEATRDSYRFLVEAEAQKSAQLLVREERTVAQHLALTNLEVNHLLIFVNSPSISDEARAALREVVTRKQELDKLVVAQNQHRQEIATITQEQERIRQNMAQIDRNSQIYQRYLKKFSEQEDRIEVLREQIEALEQEITQKRQALNEYLSNLEIS